MYTDLPDERGVGMEELKKCPFCGGDAKLIGNKNHWVFCKGCLGESQTFETVEEAIKAWNNRIPTERIVERLEERIDSIELEREMAKCYGFFMNSTVWDGRLKGLGEAIEIVREEIDA